jgi:hypothetical protein
MIFLRHLDVHQDTLGMGPMHTLDVHQGDVEITHLLWVFSTKQFVGNLGPLACIFLFLLIYYHS